MEGIKGERGSGKWWLVCNKEIGTRSGQQTAHVLPEMSVRCGMDGRNGEDECSKREEDVDDGEMHHYHDH